MKFECLYCKKIFSREDSLKVHLCEPRRRHSEKSERGVQLGFQAFLKFFEIAHGSSKLKTWNDFVVSPYYRAFVKWGRYCINVKAVAPENFLNWLLQNNKKIDHWCRDSIYDEYLLYYLLTESVEHALERGIRHSVEWEEKHGHPSKDYLRYAPSNLICHSISNGKISPWIVYNCDSGQQFLSRLSNDQVSQIWKWINSDLWSKRFEKLPSDKLYAEKILCEAGW